MHRSRCRQRRDPPAPVSALGDARFRARYDSDQDAREAILTRLNNVDGIFSSQLAIEICVGTLSMPDGAAITLLRHFAQWPAARLSTLRRAHRS